MEFISSKKGFTLIELLVVIAVIGILAAVVLASLNSTRSKARDTKRISDLKQVQVALELYRNDYGDYPSDVANSSAEWNSKLATWLVNTGYLPNVPTDPLSTGSYRYLYYSDTTTTATCNGLTFQNYEYVIMFNSENASAPAPNIALNATYNKCLHGALK